MEESWAVFWATAVVVYGIYSLTLFPSTPGGDSGELLAESCHLGVVRKFLLLQSYSLIIHIDPPGYPLLTMISYIASKLPLLRIYLDENNQWAFERHTTIAWRINHLCCIFGTLSATFIALSCLSILQKYQYSFRWGPSLVAGFLFAFSPVVWEHSIGAEVFSLNNLFCSLLIYLTILIYHSLPSSSSSSLSHTNQLYLLILFGAFLSGLTLSNQHASLLLLIVLIPFILLITYPYTMTLPYLISLSLVFSLAISSYFYLFFTSLHPSPGSWGDTTSFAGLIRHVLRSEYGTFQLGIREGSESSLERVYLYLLHSLSNGFYLNLPLCIIGLYSQFSRYPLIVTRKKIKSKVIKGSDPVSSSTDASASSTPGHEKGNKLTQRGGGGKKNIKKLPEAAIVAEEENPSELLVPLEIVCLIVAWLAYVGIWHGVLSNIPLNSPMPYGVHARFWMQPDIIICIFTGNEVQL